MINRFIPPALIGLLTLGARGGGGGDGQRPTTTQPAPNHVDFTDYMPSDTTGYWIANQYPEVTVYVGNEETDEGVWWDWYADITAVDGAFGGIR